VRILVSAFVALCLWPCVVAAQSPSPFFGTPAAIPGIIQAEDFDRGGQGVAFSDTTAANEGGQYRATEGVDIFTSSGAPGGYVIKNFAVGEWMTYTVEVAASGWYDFQVRMASKVDTARFHIEIDGIDVTGTVAAPITSTTTWEAYQWFVVKKRVPLAAGTHLMKVVSDAEWVGLDAFNITASPVGTPFGGTPAAVPGIIQAENFNEGGQGVAYSDTDAVNDGTQYRPGEGVDVFTSSGAPEPGNYVVKNFANGEWMLYTVNVPTSGMYDFKVRVATKIDTSRFHIEVDGVNVTGTVSVPATSTTTWEAYQWIVARMLVPLAAGTHHLAIVSDEQWVGLDAIEVVPGYSGTPHSGTPAAVPGTIEVENFDLGGEGVAYHDTTPTVNDGGKYRTTEGVDIFDSPGAPGGFVIKNFPAGEWMAYTINVQSAGQYDLKVRLASKIATSTFHIEIDGADVTGTVAVPQTSTTTWEAYQLHTAKTNVPLTAGTHVLKIVSDTEWVGLDKLEIVASTAPPANPPSLLFRSGFESNVSVGAPRDCWPAGCWQDLVGTDLASGFTWPPRIAGGGGQFQVRSGTNTAPPPSASTITDYIVNDIQTVTGHTGAPTRAHHVVIKKTGCTGTASQNGTDCSAQDPYVLQPTSEPGDLYISFWRKLDPALLQKLVNGWHVVFGWKSTGDYRIEVQVVTYSGTPAWQIDADNVANGGLAFQRFWRETNTTVPVPLDRWFKLEVFWHRSQGADGRVWMAVDGHKIVDKFGPNIGVNNNPINRIFLMQLYTAATYPIEQWTDDVQIWSGFPTASPGDPWYDPPYGAH
jgi:carbohydrate binding protein with CBM6 domain